MEKDEKWTRPDFSGLIRLGPGHTQTGLEPGPVPGTNIKQS